MKVVEVISVIKDPGSNAEIVKAKSSSDNPTWGKILEIAFVSPAGKHRVGQRVELQEVEGSTGY